MTTTQLQVVEAASWTADNVVEAIRDAEERQNLLPMCKLTEEMIRAAVISAQIAQAIGLAHFHPDKLADLGRMDQRTALKASVQYARNSR